jgi:hypothetical protein
VLQKPKRRCMVRLVDDGGSWKWSVFVEWLPVNIMKWSVFSDMYHTLCRIEDMDVDASWKKNWKLYCMVDAS